MPDRVNEDRSDKLRNWWDKRLNREAYDMLILASQLNNLLCG